MDDILRVFYSRRLFNSLLKIENPLQIFHKLMAGSYFSVQKLFSTQKTSSGLSTDRRIYPTNFLLTRSSIGRLWVKVFQLAFSRRKAEHFKQDFYERNSLSGSQ